MVGYASACLKYQDLVGGREMLTSKLLSQAYRGAKFSQKLQSAISLAYKTRFHLIFRFPARSKRNIILTYQFLHSRAINKQFIGGNL